VSEEVPALDVDVRRQRAELARVGVVADRHQDPRRQVGELLEGRPVQPRVEAEQAGDRTERDVDDGAIAFDPPRCQRAVWTSRKRCMAGGSGALGCSSGGWDEGEVGRLAQRPGVWVGWKAERATHLVHRAGGYRERLVLLRGEAKRHADVRNAGALRRQRARELLTLTDHHVRVPAVDDLQHVVKDRPSAGLRLAFRRGLATAPPGGRAR
jgi:hypothetical protein